MHVAAITGPDSCIWLQLRSRTIARIAAEWIVERDSQNQNNYNYCVFFDGFAKNVDIRSYVRKKSLGTFIKPALF